MSPDSDLSICEQDSSGIEGHAHEVLDVQTTPPLAQSERTAGENQEQDTEHHAALPRVASLLARYALVVQHAVRAWNTWFQL